MDMARRGYVKLSNDFYMNPKMRELRAICPSAVGSYVFAITYASDNLTDGRLSERVALYVIGMTDDELNAMCSVGLLEPDGDTGYGIHDYLAWQLSKEQIEKRKERDRNRKSVSANVSDGIQVESERNPSGIQTDSANVPDGIATECGLNTRTQEHKNTIHKETSPNGEVKKASRDEYPMDFEQWYSVYPWQTDKPGAFEAFRRAQRKTNLGTLIAKTQQYAMWIGQPGAPHCMKPASWLDRESWNDSPQPKQAERANQGRAENRLQRHLDIARNLKAADAQQMQIGA
jgi:hypothetical protein